MVTLINVMVLYGAVTGCQVSSDSNHPSFSDGTTVWLPPQHPDRTTSTVHVGSWTPFTPPHSTWIHGKLREPFILGDLEDYRLL